MTIFAFLRRIEAERRREILRCAQNDKFDVFLSDVYGTEAGRVPVEIKSGFLSTSRGRLRGGKKARDSARSDRFALGSDE
jgi:hypothetical protein